MFKNSKNNLDEMQENKLLHIEKMDAGLHFGRCLHLW